MMDAFFRITFTGTAGSGFGILVFHNGVIVGADVVGATFDGSYTENIATQALDFQITMNAPAGITPVQTGIALTTPLSMPITGSLPLGNINTGTPTLLQTPLGPVNILFLKIRDFP
jgi:hypothetical protein